MVTGQKTWIPLALRANRAGWAVADNVCGKETSLEGVAGTAVFKVFNLEVARTGLSLEESHRYGFEPVDVTIKSRSRAHAHPGAETIWVNLIGDIKSGRLLGAQMVGREGVAHRINAAAVALHGQNVGGILFSNRSGLCAALWTGMGSAAHRRQSVVEKNGLIAVPVRYHCVTFLNKPQPK